MSEEQPRQGETVGARTERFRVEEEALQQLCIDHSISEDAADLLIEQLSRKHKWETDNNAVVSMEEFDEIEAISSVKTSPTTKEGIGDNSPMETTGNTQEPPMHSPREAEPSAAILEVATVEDKEESDVDTSTQLDEKTKLIIEHINALAQKDKQREFAEADLHGSRKGDHFSWRGLAQARLDLERRNEKLATVDERILNPEELAQHRQEKKRVAENLSNIVPKEEYAREFVNSIGGKIDNHIEVSLNAFEALPEELQGAIRMGDQSIFKKYGVDSWAARQIGRSLNLREQDDEAKRRTLELRERSQEEIQKQEYKPETFVPREIPSLPDIITEGVLTGIEEERVIKERETEAARLVSPVSAFASEKTAEALPALPREEFVHDTPDVDERVTPEMLDALKNAGIHVPEGKLLTAFQAQKLMRTVLGARGTAQIEATDKRAAQTIAQASTGNAPTAFAAEVKPELSGLYDVREDGHIYNANDVSPNAPTLDNAPSGEIAASPEPKSSALSAETQKRSAPLFNAENGAVTYDRYLDPNIAADKATLDALMKGRNNTQPATLPEIVPQEQDPNLSGQYHMENGVVHTGLVEGGGQPVFPNDSRNAVTELEVFGPNPFEPNPDQNVFSGLGVLGDAPPSLDKNDDQRAVQKSAIAETLIKSEGDPDEHVFDGLSALEYNPTGADEEMEPLIVHNFNGTPEFVPELDMKVASPDWNPDAVARLIAIHRQYREQAAQGLEIPEAAKNERDEDFYREEYIKMGGDLTTLEQKIGSFNDDAKETTRLYQRMQEEWEKAGKPYDTIISVDSFYYIKRENGEGIRFNTIAEAEAYLSSRPSGEKENVAIDAQGEAMQHLIDNTPEVVNLGKTEVETASTLHGETEEDAKFDQRAQETFEGEGGGQVSVLREKNQSTKEEKKEVSESILEKYQTQFNLSKEELMSTEGFRDLSEGQQLLVLERMKSVAFDDINAEKVLRYRSRIDELSKSDSWWDNIKGVGMKATKQLQLGRMKDEVSAEWLKGTDVDATAMKKDALEGLVAQALQAKEFDVALHEGKLSTVFISPEDFGEDIDEVMKSKIIHFNEVANAYANQSFAIGEDSETPSTIVADAGRALGYSFAGVSGQVPTPTHLTTSQLKAQYESSAREMTSLLAEQEGGKWSGDNAAAWRTKLEGAVQMSRFFQDNPEVDKELETAGRNIGSAVGFKNLLVERGTYTAASAGIRWLGVSAIGLAAAPVVAALGGGVMGWRRAKQELSENDLLAVMGEKDESDDKAHEKEFGSNAKDRAKNVVSSEVLVTKLEKLLDEYQAAGETEKKTLEKKLEARVVYTTRKMEEQLIDLGSARGDRMERTSRLALTLSKAQSELGFVDKGIAIFTSRLDSILDIREEKIEANRKMHLIKQAAKGATMGAAFSGAGLLIGGMLPGNAKIGEFGAKADHQFGSGGTLENADSLAPGEQIIPGGEIPAHVVENIPSSGSEVAALVYNVKAGENLSAIMKEHLGIFRDLTPKQQENVIQNFIRDLSPQDMKDIGITDVNRINVGQHIRLDKLNEILSSKRIENQDLFGHAEQLFTRTPDEVLGVSGEGIREVALSPLSLEDASYVEGALGRTISGSESHVLHSVKGLALLPESDTEQEALAAALDHLQKEMQASGGRPLTMAEMQRILHEHNGLDAKITFPETVSLKIPNVETETASSTPLPPGIPKEHIINWQELSPGMKLEEATVLGKTYLESDAGNLYGKDVFGNLAKEWVFVRGQSAATVFSSERGEIFSSDAAIRKIQEYANAEGFTEEHGYVPHAGETVGEFLRRAHMLRVLAGGPRPETH